jgi:anti-sigma regulatory factor (Ser/Thr protein kinase)
MAHTQALNLVPRTFQSAPFVELQQSFPSQIQAISPFVDQLMRFILDFRNADGSEIEIEMALREALANAVIHGYSENSCLVVSLWGGRIGFLVKLNSLRKEAEPHSGTNPNTIGL